MSLPALADLERALAEMDAEELRLVTTRWPKH
jgi:hypothetical protein